MKVRIGTRGSTLARWQAEHVAFLLRGRGTEAAIEILTTTGDRMQQSPFQQVGTKGMFTKEIEEALRDKRIDLAVHSLKDLPTEMPEGFVLAAIPEREDARDAFVSVRHEAFSALPRDAVVGTSSVRRQAQLRALRPDLEVRELRGNVDTRLRKLQEGQCDAIVLAAAGLERLQRTEWLRERFDPQTMCPAAGQGALAIECRSEDRATQDLVAALDHSPTRFAVTVERAALGTLEGGCHVPVGVYCHYDANAWMVMGVVVRTDGSQMLWEEMRIEGERHSLAEAKVAGRALAERLLRRGAGEFLSTVENAGATGRPHA